MIKKAGKYFVGLLSRLIHYRKFKRDFLRTLPARYHLAAELKFYRIRKPTENKLARQIEQFRTSIPKVAETREIGSFSSPHSHTFRKDEKGHAETGPYMRDAVEEHIKIGTSIDKGILLRRIVEGTGVKRILELGTNTGFSGCYFLSVEGVHLVTVEGSKDLCRIAQTNMDRISSHYRIMNCLFDEAIDQLVQEGATFDAVFIDGQHEREATLHYTERVKPLMEEQSIYIFDDIYWSEDMNQAWKELCFRYNFSEAVDLLTLGICAKNNASKKTILYDLGDYIPRPEIYRKGW